MKISYILPDFDEFAYSGGLYVIFQHCNGLTAKGHEVRAFNMTGKKSRYLQLDCPVEVHHNDPSVLESNAPDIIVGTYWHTYFFLNRMKSVCANGTRLSFLVQGDDRLIYDKINAPLIYRAMKSLYRDTVPIHKIVVSRYLQEVLKSDFGEDSFYVRNGLDIRTVTPLLDGSDKTRIAARYDTSSFRGWDMVDTVLRRVAKERPDVEIHLFEMKDKKPTPYRSRFHKGLSGDELLRLFRSCDIYLSGSRYEGFGYPILEAMSQGSAVCCTDAGGNREFCVDGETSLLSSRDDADGLYRNLLRLIDDATLRKRLSKKGIAKSKEFSWGRSIDELERHFQGMPKTIAAATAAPIRRTPSGRALFVYGRDPFTTHKDWVNCESSIEALKQAGYAVTTRLFVDKHAGKFVRARLDMLMDPEEARDIRYNVYYSKKLKLGLPFLAWPFFKMSVIADIALHAMIKDKNYQLVIVAGRKNYIFLVFCSLFGNRCHYADFDSKELGRYKFDNYTVNDLQKEKDYRRLIVAKVGKQSCA